MDPSHTKHDSDPGLPTTTQRIAQRPLGQSWLPSQGLHAHNSAALSQSNAFAQAPTTRTKGTRYQRISLLGQGGMGRVWMGWDDTLKRNVAIKEPLGGAGSPESRQLTYEAMITARLEHPAIVSIHDVFEDEGCPNFVMRLVCGQPLGKLIDTHHDEQPGRLPSALIRHVLGLCEAIGYAHRCGVLHRDISPMNVLVGDDGSVHIIDWGLATHLIDLPERLGYVGTPGYIAPEQRLGSSADTRSDVWSLGALLHDVVYGSAPDALDTLDTSRAHPQLHAIIACACAHDPEARYADGFAMAHDLQRWFEGHRVHAYATTPWRALRRLIGVYRTGLGVTLLLIVAFVSLAAWGTWRTREEALRARGAESMAILRAQDANKESARTRRISAKLLHDKAMEHARDDDLFVAEHLAVQSLLMHDNPRARGLMSVLAARWRPTSRLLMTLPECDHPWRLTDSPDIALCAGNDYNSKTSWVRAWSHGDWIWGYTLDHIEHFACAIAKFKSVGGQVLVDAHPHEACERDLWTHDVRTGRILHEDVAKGLLVSGQNALRVSEDASYVLNYPVTRGMCEGTVMHLTRGPAQALWVVCSDHTIFKVDARGEVVVARISKKDKARWLTFDEHGSGWIATTRGKIFALDDSHTSWDVEGPIKKMFMIPDSPLLVLFSAKGVIKLFDTQQRTWGVSLPERYVDVRPGGAHRLTALQHNQDVVSWDFAPHTRQGRYRSVAGISSLDWSQDGTRVAALDGHGNVHMFEPGSGQQWSRLHWSKGVGKWIAAAHTFDGFVMIGMFSQGVHTLSLEDDRLHTTRMEAFSPKTIASRLMVSPRDDIMASLYGREVRLKRAHETFTTDRDVSLGEYLKDADSTSSGKVVAITSKYNVTRWDWRGEPTLMHTHQDTVHVASINVRGELMLAERASLMHVDASGKLVKRWDVDGASILDVEWVPDRTWAVSAHKDGSVHIWDVEQGRLIARSTPHTERVAKIAISPDGRWLATGGWDGHIVIWDLSVIDSPVGSYQHNLHTLSESRVASFELITQAP